MNKFTGRMEFSVVGSLSAMQLAGIASFLFLVIGIFVGTTFRSTPRVKESSRVAVISSIGTAVPKNKCNVDFFLQLCSTMGYNEKTLQLVQKIALNGGIKTRHTSVDSPADKYNAFLEASPRARAEVWEANAPRLAIAASRQALAQWPHGSASDITHVVVHSCTGFSAPGLDFALITALGLPSSTRKMGVNYMGCFGFFTAMYVAKQIIEADETGRAVVLVCCAEVCGVHVSKEPTPELIVGNSLFADGSAAAIFTHAGFRGAVKAVGPVPDSTVLDPSTHTPAFRLCGMVEPDTGVAYEWAVGTLASEIVPETPGHMTWRQSTEAGRYDMYLDRGIPAALANILGTKALSLLSRVGITNPWNGRTAWAIHPGGKAILKGFETALGVLRVPTNGLEESSNVLSGFGNMSSPTIAFVLQRVLTGSAGAGADRVFVAGFGPGLTVEYGGLYKLKAGQTGPPSAPSSMPALPSEEEAIVPPIITGLSMEQGIPTEGSDSTSDPATPSRVSPTELEAENDAGTLPSTPGRSPARTGMRRRDA